MFSEVFFFYLFIYLVDQQITNWLELNFTVVGMGCQSNTAFNSIVIGSAKNVDF